LSDHWCSSAGASFSSSPRAAIARARRSGVSASQQSFDCAG